jgi:hypothetical protein
MRGGTVLLFGHAREAQAFGVLFDSDRHALGHELGVRDQARALKGDGIDAADGEIARLVAEESRTRLLRKLSNCQPMARMMSP